MTDVDGPSRRTLRFWLCAPVLFAAHALAEPPADADMERERDALIRTIASGDDYERSVKQFAALLARRDAIQPTSRAAKEKEHERQQSWREWQDAYQKTADYEVSWRCTLSVDPAHPAPSREGRFSSDWGKVVRKEKIQLPPKSALADPETTTVYEVAGVREHEVFQAERFGVGRTAFQAEVGDWAIVCKSGEKDLNRGRGADSTPADLPDWARRVISSGFAVKVKGPPRITTKSKWNPIHVTRTMFFWAIHDVKWVFPDEAFILCNLEVSEDLGGGRFLVQEQQKVSWILEVPPSVKNQDLLVPGHAVWVIMGHHRFDPGLKKLVLVAEDLEARYIDEP